MESLRHHKPTNGPDEWRRLGETNGRCVRPAPLQYMPESWRVSGQPESPSRRAVPVVLDGPQLLATFAGHLPRQRHFMLENNANAGHRNGYGCGCGWRRVWEWLGVREMERGLCSSWTLGQWASRH
ncbi:hypothetical protein KR009_004120 [Drosophila setifemur]|nr:hypothetical protein KR009_004120 [Drosophila setifemur]